MLGSFDGDKITIEEIHRFPNDPVLVNGTLYWDVYRIFFEIKQAIIKALEIGDFESIGIDTWGVDFGLIREDGSLVECPVHHRDARTKGLMAEAFDRMPRERFYSITGIQFMELNTVFQLWSIVTKRPELLDQADTVLLMPDLLNFFLTGVKKTEYSIATTTQLLRAKSGTWAGEVFDVFGIPERLVTDIIPSGTLLGSLRPEICQELECPPVKVVAVAGHDTQCAVVAIPSSEKDFLFISSGTWTLFGTEIDRPILNEKSASLNLTNEGGYGGKITFLKNIIGLWLIQESRRQWKREGKDYSFTDLAEMARGAEGFKSYIDPDDPDFMVPGNIPRRIQEYCRRTDQDVPSTVPEIARCVYQSLALKYRWALEEIEACTERRYECLHMVGGGVQDSFLCQLTANACSRPVIAGPVEATVLGNIAVQMITLGSIPDIAEARRLIADSNPLASYEPQDVERWNESYAKFLSACGIAQEAVKC